MNNTKRLREGFLVSFLYLLLLMLTIFIPGIELLTLFILPIPFVYFASRFGWKIALVPFFFTLIISIAFIPLLSIPFTILSGLGGIMIGGSVYRGVTAYETWARGSAGFLVGLLFVFVFIQWILDVNLVDEMKKAMEESIKTTQVMLEGFGLNATPDQMVLIEEQVFRVLNLLPVIMAATAMTIGFVTQWISYKILNWFTKQSLRFPPFREYHLPKAMVWIYFITIILSMFDTEPTSSLYIGTTNVMHLAGILLTLQGLAFVFYYTHVKGVSKVVPIITTVLTFVFPFIGLYLMRILGIIDLGFSLRQRVTEKK